jgi:hypothetical protein
MTADLLQQLTSQLSGGNLDALSQQLGVDQGTANQAIQAALPMILGAMAKNASSPDGAQALTQALQKDHDGSILDNLGGFLGSSDNGSGSGILGHVFKASLPMIISSVSKMSGMQEGQAGSLLENLAPVVMGALGKQQRQQGLDAGGIADILSGMTQQARGTSTQGSAALDMLSNILDRDGDGNMMDDIGGMLGKFLR